MEALLLALDHIFCAIFTVELSLRVTAFRYRFFIVAANWLDLVIVFGAVVEMYILNLLNVNLPDMTMARLLRLFRLVKILRVVRGMRSVRPLRLLLISIVSSISTLLWSIMFLCTIQILSALLVTQLMQSPITDRAVDLALRETLYH